MNFASIEPASSGQNARLGKRTMNSSSSQTQGRQKKKKKLSPILDQILYGSSSVVLNVLRKTRELGGVDPFFESVAMNRVIIFKYPNFQVELSDQGKANLAGKDAALSHERPVETAIYIPNDEEFPQDGGYAVYIRQRDSEELLQRYVGVSTGSSSEAMKRDWRKLQLIDEIPSLDPFLLKSTFDGQKIIFNTAYLDMADKEEDSIKLVIGSKVKPIVSKALGVGDDARSEQKSQRFVDAIWDPTLPEAGLFIEAFKIDRGEVGNVFSAWKGVSFYQYQFSRNRGALAEILKWFKSETSVPLDIRQNRPYAEQQNMFKAAVQRKMINVLTNIQNIFKDFDECYDTFIKNGDPIPFRNFLVTSHFRYWLLGYCCTSLLHCRNIFDRFMESSIKGQLTFDQMNDMLTNLEGTLSSQSQASSDLS